MTKPYQTDPVTEAAVTLRRVKDDDLLTFFEFVAAAQLEADEVRALQPHAPTGKRKAAVWIRLASDYLSKRTRRAYAAHDAGEGYVNAELVGSSLVFTKGTGGTTLVRLPRADWEKLINLPSAFPPQPHQHQWKDIVNPPAAFPPAAHKHRWEDITNVPANLADAGYVNWRFNADNDVILDGVNDTTVTLVHAETFKKHTHAMAQIDGLAAALNNKADLDDNQKLRLEQIPKGVFRKEWHPKDEAELLALDAYIGDVAHLNNERLMLVEGSPRVRRSWLNLDALGQVTSVNGQTGIVKLKAADVGAIPSGTQATDLGGAAARHTHSLSSITDKEQWLKTYLTAGTGITVTEVKGRLEFALAATGQQVDWADIENKPEVFASSWGKVSDKPSFFPTSWSYISGKPAAFPTNAANFTHFDEAVRGAVDAAFYNNTLSNFGKAAANAVGDSLVSDTLAISRGEGVTRLEVKDAGSGAGLTLEGADGKVRLTGVAKLVVEGGELIAVDANTAKLALKGGAGGSEGVEMSYSPKYVRKVEIINPLPFCSDIIGRATIRTAFAQSDGSDIRVFSEAGIQRPSAVVSALPGTNYIDYEVVWAETMDASEKRVYEVRYGDEYAPERPYHQETLSRLINMGNSKKFGKLRVDTDARQRYATPDLGAEGIWDLVRMPETQTLPEPLPWLDSQVHSILWDFFGIGSRSGRQDYPSTFFKDAYDNNIVLPTIMFRDAEGHMVGGLGLGSSYGASAVPFQKAIGGKNQGDYYSPGMAIRCRRLSDGYSWDIAEADWHKEHSVVANLRYRVGYGWVLNIVETRGHDIFAQGAADHGGVYTGATEYVAFKSLGMTLDCKNTRHEDPATWVTRNFGLERTAKATVGDEQPYTP